MKRLSTIFALVGSLVMAGGFGVACSTSHTRDEDTLGAPLGQSTAGGPADPNRPTPAAPSTEAPPLEHVPALTNPPTGPAPATAPVPTAAETVEPPSPSPTTPHTPNPLPAPSEPVPVPTPAPPVTPPAPSPMPAPTTPPSMMPMAAGEPMQLRDGGVPIVVPRIDGGAPRDAALPRPDAASPAPARDAGPGITRTGDGGLR